MYNTLNIMSNRIVKSQQEQLVELYDCYEDIIPNLALSDVVQLQREWNEGRTEDCERQRCCIAAMKRMSNKWGRPIDISSVIAAKHTTLKTEKVFANAASGPERTADVANLRDFDDESEASVSIVLVCTDDEEEYVEEVRKPTQLQLLRLERKKLLKRLARAKSVLAKICEETQESVVRVKSETLSVVAELGTKTCDLQAAKERNKTTRKERKRKLQV